MTFWTIFGIALALALDAFAVALTVGFKLRNVDLRQTFRLAFHFGLFQALMNVLGWAGGLAFRRMIESVDHWLAFLLLFLVGGNMILGGFKPHDDTVAVRDPTRGGTLVMLSIATSIDALAVGLSFSVLKIAILWPAVIIGIVAGVMTTIGIRFGRTVGDFTRLGAEAEIVGGVVLLGIGVNILRSHGVF
jgi:putative Mn2+ efflux pump MntP